MTAVQYAKQSLEQLADALNNGDIDELNDAMVNKIWDEALQQEKEQHGLTWDTAIFKHNERGFNPIRTYEDFDEYFNNQYKNHE